MKKVGLALLGLGVVGSGTYKILVKNREYIKNYYGVDIEVMHVLEKDVSKAEALGIDKKIVSTDINNVIKNPDISIVAEFFGGIEPARSFLIASLKAGKSVVTSNKEMFAKNWGELETAAKEGNAGLYFEASCVGGVPIIRTLQESMQGNNVLSIMGIFNGTTNYILSNMADKGLEYADVLKEAQRLGYAEANPSADVDGFDSMYKLSILSTLAFHKKVPLDKIYREGISKINKKDIEFGKEFGFTLKLLAIGKRVNGKIEARVHPSFIENNHPLATVKGSFNAVMIVGDNVGDIMLYGRGAGDLPTGSAIVSDIIYCAKQTEHSLTVFDGAKDADFTDDFESKYYIRMSVADKSGVLAKITGVFGKYDVSIDAMQQKQSGDAASVIFFSHKNSEKNVMRAISEIKSLAEVKDVDAVIRVVD
ncbi:MAG: homoserine dehydrogenase [Clostridia bacterium]|nr:homoserine dehydrogenase [Clostridia bacterium]